MYVKLNAILPRSYGVSIKWLKRLQRCLLNLGLGIYINVEPEIRLKRKPEGYQALSRFRETE